MYQYKMMRFIPLGVFLLVVFVLFGLPAGSKVSDGMASEEAVMETALETVAMETGMTSGTVATTGTAGEAGDDEKETDPGNLKETTIAVYVCGQVEKPGVYWLPEGARLSDAVNAAGGLKKHAGEDVLNLAQILTDGQRYYVPSEEEAESYAISGSESISGEMKASTDGAARDGIVNINQAGEAELMTLPGIGEAKAKAIVADREENGSFADVSDIKRVSGIGESLYNQIKSSISVD